jgi:hypothetical protein
MTESKCLLLHSDLMMDSRATVLLFWLHLSAPITSISWQRYRFILDFFLLFTPSFIALHCYLHRSLLIPIWDWHWCVPYVTSTVVSGCPNLAILKLKCLTSSFIVLHLVNESSDPGPGDQSMVINKARLALTKWLRIMAMHTNLRSQKFIRAPGLFHQVAGLESIS